MSHDVHFWPKSGSLDLGAVQTWLESRPDWTVSAGSGAVYENSDTGVYLTLDFGDSPPPGERYAHEEDNEEGLIVASINVYRPSFFGLECAIVLAELAAEFDLLANDFQDEDITPVAFAQEWFVSRWNVANGAGYQAIGPSDADANTMERSTLVAAWEWNWGRAALQERLGGTIFVPKISPVRTLAGLRTAVVWTDAIPISLPPVDHVIVYRNELQPRKFFGAHPPMHLQSRDAVIHALGAFAQRQEDRVDFVEYPTPFAVKEWVTKLRSPANGFEGIVAWDLVLDSELLARATQGN